MISSVTESSSKVGLLSKEKHEENQYLKLIKDIDTFGTMENGRNGNAKTIFGSGMHFSLQDGTIPILTTKKVAWKTCLKELLWFIKGSTDNKELQEQNVKIWNDNASRDFLDSRGLNYEENDLGPIYGHQWRHFNAKYKDEGCKASYEGEGIDQLQNIINALNDPEQRYSRRLVMSAWNPQQIDDMALPPCHILCQFCVTDGNKLSCSLYQRSGDVGLGVPFNIASYAFLTHILANHCGLEAEEFVYFLGNAHIYEEHIDALKPQILKEPYPFPTIEFKENVSDINNINIDSIKIAHYNHHETIKMEMKA